MVATSVVSVDAKLSKLEMPAFSGDVAKWTAFWEQVEAVIDQSDLPDNSYMSTPSDAHLYNLLEKSIKSVRNP